MSARLAVGMACLATACGFGQAEPEVSTLGLEHAAAGALMVYEPTHPEAPGWRPLCGVALVHPRVAQTAGHCIQFLRAGLALGALEAAWVSFQQDPTAHFAADPALEDPATGGWHEIASVHDNPDNADFVTLRRSDTLSVLQAWGDFHDSGAIVLAGAVTNVEPFRMAGASSGAVERLLERAGCGTAEDTCRLLEIAYGLQEVPPATLPPSLVRRAARLRYRALDSIWVSTYDELPGSGYGRSCPGDSGSPIVLLGRSAASAVIVAISSSPAEPFGVPCTGGALQYRVDTESHRRFIAGVVRSVEGR